MIKSEWLVLLTNVILECVEAVFDRRAFDAEPWIMIEEQIGYENTKLLFNEKNYAPVTHMLDLFCHSAQHDRAEVNGIDLVSVGKALIECSKIIDSGTCDFSLLDLLDGHK